VGVERHDQLRGRYPLPDAKIERVAAHHPAEKQIQTLAGRTGGWPRKEITDAWPFGHAAVRGFQIERHRPSGKAVERGLEVVGAAVASFEKESLHRSSAIDHLPQHPQHGDDVGFARPAMDDAGKRRTVAGGIEPAHICGGRRPHHRQHSLDRLQHAGDASEREGGGNEPDDLPIVVSSKSPDNLDRIGRGISVVEIGVQLVEDGFQFQQVSTLNSQLSILLSVET